MRLDYTQLRAHKMHLNGSCRVSCSQIVGGALLRSWCLTTIFAAVLSSNASAQDLDYVRRTSSLPHNWTQVSAKPRFLTAAVAGRTDYNPVFSSDGKRVLFSRTMGKENSELYVVPAAGGDSQRLSPELLNIDETRPKWSPQNGLIAFTGCMAKPQGGSTCRPWIIEGNGTNPHPVVVTGASDYVIYPSWYPDGRHIAVMDAGNLTVLRLDITSGATRALTDRTQIFAGMPSVSPDGEWIAFAGQKNGGQRYNQNRNNIWLEDRAGNIKSLEVNPIQGRAPTWSPDGNKIAFESYRGSPDHYAIFVVRRDGTGLTQVTDYALGAQHPSWSRDGKEMAFAYQSSSDPTAWGIGIIEYPNSQR